MQYPEVSNHSFCMSGVSTTSHLSKILFKSQNSQLKEKLAQLDQLKSKMETLKNNLQKKRISDREKNTKAKVDQNHNNNGTRKAQIIQRTCSNDVYDTGYASLLNKVSNSIHRSHQLGNKPLTQQRDLNVTSDIGPYSYKKITSLNSLNDTFSSPSNDHDKLEKVLNAFKQFKEESKKIAESHEEVLEQIDTEEYKGRSSDKGTSISQIPSVSPTSIPQFASFAPEDFAHEDKNWVSNGFVYGKELGRGKFGQVYLAKHIETGCIVAIKRVLKQNIKKYNMVNRFIEEIKLHSKLDHPNIVKFYGFYEDQESICIVLEYLNGGTLFDYLNSVGCLSLKEATSFLRQIIEALDYLHQKSIIHRDLKPQNIVISSTGVAKICDFGWSTVVQTYRTTFCGTLDYASPEIIQHKQYDQSVDVWCVGVLTYELLIGRAPFENDDRVSVMQDIINVGTSSLPYISCLAPEVIQFIEAVLQKDPSQRPKIYELLEFSLFKLHTSLTMQANWKKLRKNTIG